METLYKNKLKKISEEDLPDGKAIILARGPEHAELIFLPKPHLSKEELNKRLKGVLVETLSNYLSSRLETGPKT